MGLESGPREALRERRLGRAALGRLLDELEASDVAGPVTLYATPGGVEQGLRSLERGGGAPDQLGQLAPRLEGSDTGAVVFTSANACWAILPPFPVEHDLTIDGWDGSQLRSMLAKDYVVGVVLIRLGRYAVGVFQGEALVASKTDTRYVKGRHSAGGTSQKRFARIREKQVQLMYEKTCSVTRQILSTYEHRLDYILLGGEKFTLQGFRKECPYLQGLSSKVLGRVLNVREPNLAALKGCGETIWESRVVSIQPAVEGEPFGIAQDRPVEP